MSKYFPWFGHVECHGGATDVTYLRGFSLKDLENVDYPFIAIAPKFTPT